MTIIHAIILGIVEGLTEFLPISSTGHLIFTSYILGLEQSEFLKSFEIIIQLGAILAVFVLYIKKILRNIFVIKPLLISFLPAAGVGFVLYKFIRDALLGNSLVVVISLFVGGVILLFVDDVIKSSRVKEIEMKSLGIMKSFMIGIFQAFSIIPGVSRAAATIVGGMSQGLSRQEAVEYSFLLALPTIGAATALDLYKSNFSFSQNEWVLLAVGFFVSFVTGWTAVVYFLRFVKNHTLKSFGVYRIIVSIIYFILFR